MFFLLTMLVVSMQPILSIHSCKGMNKHSVSFLIQAKDKSCCSIIQAGDHNQQVDDVINPVQEDACCATKLVWIKMDDYQSELQLLNASIFRSLTGIPFFIGVSLYDVAGINFALSKQLKIRPPESYDFQNTDLLTYICIYRI